MENCPATTLMKFYHPIEGQITPLLHGPRDHALNSQREGFEDPVDIDLAVIHQRLPYFSFGSGRVCQTRIVHSGYEGIDIIDDPTKSRCLP